MLGIIGIDAIADLLAAGDLAPHRVDEAVHQTALVLLQIGDDVADMRAALKRLNPRTALDIGKLELHVLRWMAQHN